MRDNWDFVGNMCLTAVFGAVLGLFIGLVLMTGFWAGYNMMEYFFR